ncbi:MAG: hypothetical protein ABIG90_03380 [bacterium]
MKKILILSMLSVFIMSLFAVPALVSAGACNFTDPLQPTCPSGYFCDSVTNPTTPECKLVGTASPITNISGVDALVRAVARWISIVVSVIAVIFIVLGGASYITAGGDAEKAGAARQKIVYGLVGLAIAALAWGAEAIVRSVLSLK